jgi:hypothetical protein
LPASRPLPRHPSPLLCPPVFALCSGPAGLPALLPCVARWLPPRSCGERSMPRLALAGGAAAAIVLQLAQLRCHGVRGLQRSQPAALLPMMAPSRISATAGSGPLSWPSASQLGPAQAHLPMAGKHCHRAWPAAAHPIPLPSLPSPCLLLPLLRVPLCCWLSAHGQLLCSRWQPTLRGHAWQVADSITAPPIPTQHCSAFSYCRAHSSWRCTAAGSGQHQLGLCCSPLLPASSLSKFNVCAPAQLSSASLPGCTGYRV